MLSLMAGVNMQVCLSCGAIGAAPVHSDPELPTDHLRHFSTSLSTQIISFWLCSVHLKMDVILAFEQLPY